MNKNIFLLWAFVLVVLSSTAQNYKGILWVVPNHTSVLPINNTTTGHAELNEVLEDFHVESYRFLDSIFLECTGEKEAVYEIRLEENYAYLESDLAHKLSIPPFKSISGYNNLFKIVCHPYYEYTQNATVSLFTIKDSTITPCSPTRSHNAQMNDILERYNVVLYKYYCPISPTSKDTLYTVIEIKCDYSELLGLYHALLPLNHFFELIYVLCSGTGGLEETNIDDSKKTLPIVFPNPVQDYISISGIQPQSVTLYDGMGRVVFTQTDYTDNIDMSHLSKGIYLLHIISNEGTVYIKKLIKQ